MAKKRSKRKRGATKGPKTSGGVMQSMLGGFKRAAGAAPSRGAKKSSRVETVLTILVLAAGVAFFLYRFYGR